MNNQTATICVYAQEYIFRYQFKFGKHEIKLENMTLISLSTSKSFIFITDIRFHLSLKHYG